MIDERRVRNDAAMALVADIKTKLARLAVLDVELPEDDWRRVRLMNRQIESVENGLRISIELHR